MPEIEAVTDYCQYPMCGEEAEAGEDRCEEHLGVDEAPEYDDGPPWYIEEFSRWDD